MMLHVSSDRDKVLGLVSTVTIIATIFLIVYITLQKKLRKLTAKGNDL